jgi:hypothetical protein
MKLYKLVIYSGEKDFETKEYIVDEEVFKGHQQALINKNKFFLLKDKTLKTELVKECIPATERDIRELNLVGALQTGHKRLHKPSVEAKKQRSESAKKGLKSLGDWVKQQEWYKVYEAKNKLKNNG